MDVQETLNPAEVEALLETLLKALEIESEAADGRND